MKKYSIIIAILFFAATSFAQKMPLLPFLKWHTNNAPDCRNVVLTKDSIVLPVKNKCRTEGQLENWRPSVDISNDKLKFKVPAGSGIQLTVTYKFLPVADDVLGFYGSYEPESDNSNIAFSRSLVAENISETTLPASDGYTIKVLKINFSNESSNPVWKALTALNGSMNFSFTVTNSSGKTHQGSKAIIKMVKLEVIQ
jgi:hypothetical protein